MNPTIPLSNPLSESERAILDQPLWRIVLPNLGVAFEMSAAVLNERCPSNMQQPPVLDRLKNSGCLYGLLRSYTGTYDLASIYAGLTGGNPKSRGKGTHNRPSIAANEGTWINLAYAFHPLNKWGERSALDYMEHRVLKDIMSKYPRWNPKTIETGVIYRCNAHANHQGKNAAVSDALRLDFVVKAERAARTILSSRSYPEEYGQAKAEIAEAFHKLDEEYSDHKEEMVQQASKARLESLLTAVPSASRPSTEGRKQWEDIPFGAYICAVIDGVLICAQKESRDSVLVVAVKGSLSFDVPGQISVEAQEFRAMLIAHMESSGNKIWVGNKFFSKKTTPLASIAGQSRSPWYWRNVGSDMNQRSILEAFAVEKDWNAAAILCGDMALVA